MNLSGYSRQFGEGPDAGPPGTLIERTRVYLQEAELKDKFVYFDEPNMVVYVTTAFGRAQSEGRGRGRLADAARSRADDDVDARVGKDVVDRQLGRVGEPGRLHPIPPSVSRSASS